MEPQNPVGSPATYGTPLATFMAWRTLTRYPTPETREAMQKAENWLIAMRPNNVPAAAVILWSEEIANRSGTLRTDAIGFLRAAQSRDGGWGPYHDSPPEAFDTELVLIALAQVRDQPGVLAMIERGRAWLKSMQLADGSWPATTRPAGAQSYAQRLSTTGWATLALLATADCVGVEMRRTAATLAAVGRIC